MIEEKKGEIGSNVNQIILANVKELDNIREKKERSEDSEDPNDELKYRYYQEERINEEFTNLNLKDLELSLPDQIILEELYRKENESSILFPYQLEDQNSISFVNIRELFIFSIFVVLSSYLILTHIAGIPKSMGFFVEWLGTLLF